MGQALVTLGVRMDRVTLTVPAEPVFHPAVRLVVGGIGSRVSLTYDEVSELQLAVESLVAHREPAGAALEIQAEVLDDRVSLRVGPFVADPDPGGRLVLERLVAASRVTDGDGGEWIELDAGAGGGGSS